MFSVKRLRPSSLHQINRTKRKSPSDYVADDRSELESLADGMAEASTRSTTFFPFSMLGMQRASIPLRLLFYDTTVLVRSGI